MSCTQPPLTDRSPSDQSSISLTHEFDPTGLVQRCVIIQRDKNGFGLTVSGDNPVFVQLVKEDGAAMRAGVQTGDRIIKVNGTLVTHSNHIEVVKLIKSGSYVALTVLGRPPGLPQIPLEAERDGEEGEAGLFPCLSVGHSPGLSEQSSPSIAPRSPQDHITSPALLWGMKEEYSKKPKPKLLKDIQDAKKHIPLLQDQLSKAAGTQQDRVPWPRDVDVDEGEGGLSRGEQTPHPGWDSSCDISWTNSNNNNVPGSPLPESSSQTETCHSPKTTPQDRNSINSCSSPDTEDIPDQDSNSQCSLGSPSTRLITPIIGAEDDYFDTQQEQISGNCSCFQSIELLKSRPAHLSAVLHHVVSQFDPAPLLCYLYADLYKHTNSKDTRRLFIDLHSFFMERTANLKVPVPESIAAELERRRLELIPEDLCRQYTQLLQDTLLPDIQKNLEDFRQKRSMGLTLAEGELSKLDPEKVTNPLALEKERACAEHIISKIEDILLTSQPTEEEKCTTMQYVILTYMKHLGVKVKEPRSLEPKRVRINFLPKIKKSIKPEKEGEEKVKKPRFPSILGQPRRPSRVDSTSISKAMELNKQRPQKQLSQPAISIPEHQDPSPGRVRGSQSSEGSDASAYIASPPHSAPAGIASDPTGLDSDSGLTSPSLLPRKSEGLQPGDAQENMAHTVGTHFDFSPYTLDQLQEEERENYRMDGLGVVGSSDVHSEDDQGNERESDQDSLNWQQLVNPEVLTGLTAKEIKRQEVINELFCTERHHLRMLKVLDYVFYQRLSRDGILPPADIKLIFTNLEDIIQLHVSITEQMTALRKKNETSVIGQIGNDLLAWFSGGEEEKIQQAVGTFCSNQPSALELIKNRQKKDQRFSSFIQEAESNRLCRRFQLKDFIPIEMLRLTKYPLLLENIAKFTEDTEERDKIKRAWESCRKILHHVNQAVKEAENKQRLEDYQRRLDLSSLKQSENPMIAEFKNLDLTKRKMVHEGPLSWKVNKDKTIELYTLLLEDILVLLQKQDERLVLKCHSKNLAGTADTKHIFSPIIKLNTVMVRSVATDIKSFFVLSMSENGAQIYELMAQTVLEQRTWQCLITQRAAMKTKPHNIIPLTQADAERDAIDIINTEEPKLSKDTDCTTIENMQSTDKDDSGSMGLQAPPTMMNPFEGIKSDDEEEELPLDVRAEVEEGAVDEEEVKAFLDGELSERLSYLQERSRQGIAIDDQDLSAFDFMPSRAEEALRTLAALKQVLLNHLAAREEAEKDREGEQRQQRKGRTPGCLQRSNSLRAPENGCGATPASAVPLEGGGLEKAETGKEEGNTETPSGDTSFFETLEDCGLLEVMAGSGESSTDDDGGGEAQWNTAADLGIDLTKLLSSSSQTGGGGPNLSRQVMTHLRLLQANLQHLKEVETKYNELRQNLGKTSTDSDEVNDKI